MSSLNSSEPEEDMTPRSHSRTPNPQKQESQKNANGAPSYGKRGARVHVRVSAECKERLVWMARQLGATECSIIEGLVEAGASGLEGKARSVVLSKDTYLFVDFTLQRVTARLVRTMKGVVKEGETVEETHGSRERCWLCEDKPTNQWNHEVMMDRIHVFYACDKHKPRAARPLFLVGRKPL